MFPYVWVRLLNLLGDRSIDNKAELYYIYAKSWLGRYMPGKVTWLIGKVIFAQKSGVSTDILIVSSTLEMVAQVLSTFAVGTIFLLLGSVGVNPQGSESINFGLMLTVIAACLFIFISLAPMAMNRSMQLIYKIRKRDSKTLPSVNRAISLKALGLFIAVAVGNTLPQFVLFYSMMPLFNVQTYFYVSGAFLLSGVLGLIAVFAPSGIGVREGFLLFFLERKYAPEIAVLVTIVQRIWSIIADLLFYLSAVVIRNIRKGNSA
jgi:hypothetical protein